MNLKRAICYAGLLCLSLILFLYTIVMGQSSPVTLENDYFRYVIASDGKNLNFIDKRTNTDYCDRREESYCMSIKQGGKEYKVTSISLDNNNIVAEFSGSGITALLKTTVNKNYIVLEVDAIKGGDIDSFVFTDVPLTLKGLPDEPFAACALSLNLFTRVDQLPALQTHLWTECYKQFGLTGAKVALIGVPQAQILPTLQEVIMNAEELPKTTTAGPWAQDVPFNHGSYLFNFGDLTEANVDEWIAMVKRIGFNQIDNHGGGTRFFRWGDFYLNREKWPEGWETFKRIVARLHQEGIGSIFHTYSALIDKNSKYVTPVPHPQLDAYRSFTLSEPISNDATEIKVIESTADVSTLIGMFVHNSVTLHIDNELVTFSGVTKEPPFKFTGCKRGVCGTNTSSHESGAKARHLKEIVGLFMPDAETPLFEEIAKNNADIVNYCDFDGIYFDAHGGGLFRGIETAWYYDTKFIYLVWKHLKKPVGMEFGDMRHHWWQFRSRWQALDFPRRGYKRFIDKHVASVNRGLLLPLFLGWWSLNTWNPPQTEPTYPDIIEYLGSKLIGYNAGLSLHGGVDRESLQKFPAYQRLAGILKNYEELSHANYFDESVKKKLREFGKDFSLFKDADGRWRFKPVQYARHKVEGINHRSSSWQMNSPFKNQPVKLRIEALMSVSRYDSPGNITLTDFTKEKDLPEKLTAKGVMLGFQPSQEQVKVGTMSGYISALNSGEVSQNGAYAKIGKTFEPWLNLGVQQGVGVWIYGDGQGEMLNFRLKSPDHLALGALADHYIPIDFTGWRYFELVETESERHDDYKWPEDPALYETYREGIDYKIVETFSIWYNNLPSNKQVKCYISPVKALPLVAIKIKNPSVTINGKTLVFPVEMESGSYLEFNSASDCKLYGPRGELLAEVNPNGEIPELKNGLNDVAFTGEGAADVSIRATINVISQGEPF
ncbi:MAG: hypothetical protein M1426_00470 [Patescibacteria group bacterium]|nr:hypothetical protein [Patescibacteria group bacterium]